MEVAQFLWTADRGWDPHLPGDGGTADWVLVFGERSSLAQEAPIAQLRQAYPQAIVMGCSTAGEIVGEQVIEAGVSAVAVTFEHTRLQTARVALAHADDSYSAGQQLAQSLPVEGLRHVFVLSEGLQVNGSTLVRGLVDQLPEGVAVTGGLSGDGSQFAETWVLFDGDLQPGLAVALGFYGDRLHIGYGSWGGWDPFGPDRVITQSSGNVLYALDGQSALDLYKQYLGDYAAGLPATGLLFPLSLQLKTGETGLTRTILAIDEEHRGLVFAGDVPMGATVRLMRANFDRLVDGAMTAAETTQSQGLTAPELAICISCVGRKLVLKQRIEEEVEAVRDVLGPQATIAGFYSYGEIAPFRSGAPCRLHNQTMTITTSSEV